MRREAERRHGPAAWSAGRLITATVAVATVVATALIVAPATPADAVDEVLVPPSSGSWDVEGRGFGHGIGMSQWGAQGAALRGLTRDQILDFYYPGTASFDIGQDYALRVRLTTFAGAPLALLGPVPGDRLTLRDEATGATATLAAGARVELARSGSGLALTTVVGSARTPALVGGASVVTGPVEVVGAAASTWAYDTSGAGRRYPGALRVLTSGTGVDVVAQVAMEQYLRGVVPREAVASWAPAALQAQAVAARTYALAVRPATGAADLCDTTSCQVYNGSATATSAGVVTEQYDARTDAAVAATARIARYYGGGPALTQFSSSNGGFSNAGSKPYLVARADPYTGTAPGDTVSRWTGTLSVERVQRSCPSGGTLQRVVLTRDGNGDLGGRILSARLECSTGVSTVATPAFGLLSSWWRVTQAGAPFGSVDSWSTAIDQGLVKATVSGWTADPDAPTASIQVQATVDGVVLGTGTANLSRPDVAAVLPDLGAAHGYAVTVTVPAGDHSVCARALDVPSGSATSLGCKTLSIPSLALRGGYDSLSATAGHVLASGWAIDPAISGPTQVRVSVTGAADVVATASVTRTDVAAAFPSAGPDHGFSVDVPVASGVRTACVTIVGAAGRTVPLGCRTVTVAELSARGSVDSVSPFPGGITVSGWAVNPAATADTYVWLSVDGAGFPVRTDQLRDDVRRAVPGAGPTPGFAVGVSSVAGPHTVCVTAVGSGAASDTALGCSTVTVPGGPPFGNLEVVAGGTGVVQVVGWAIDPDTSAAVYLWVDVDGAGHYALAATRRDDVAAVFPSYGAAHGFDHSAPAVRGSHRVCVTIVNSGVGSNTPLGCQSVAVR